MKYRSFGALFEAVQERDSYWKEKAILDFTIELNQLMKKRGLSKKQFAAKIEKSQAYITKVFKGNANFTIESMVKLSRALDGEINIHITPKEENIKTWFRVLESNNNTNTESDTPLSWSKGLEEETVCEAGKWG